MSKNLSEPGVNKSAAANEFQTRQLLRRPGLPEMGGLAIYEIKVFEDSTVINVGDDKFVWQIPEDLGGAEIIKVEAFLTTAGVGSTQIAIRKSNPCAVGSDILSTKISIDSGECNSKDAAVQPAIVGGFMPVAWGDHLHIDVDSVATNAKGLGVILVLSPSALGSVVVQGAQGPPGGVTNWSGQWLTATAYQEGDVVNNNGTTYVATADHVSDASTEPGVGANWETVWMVLSTGHQISTLSYIIDGSGQVLDVGIKGPGIPVYFNCIIREATLLADTFGSVVVDIWKDTYGNYAPTDADSITAASPLTLALATKTTDTVLNGWTTSILNGDVLRFNIDSCSQIHSLTVGLKLERI